MLRARRRTRPAPVDNAPGAPALRYRVGTHAAFLEAMRDRRRRQPGASRGLRAREPDDPAVALMDAWAARSTCSPSTPSGSPTRRYLRTATELLSLVELARTVGYERGPGRASETMLAFTLEDSPGAPPEVPVPVGTKVASLPGPGETPADLRDRRPTCSPGRSATPCLPAPRARATVDGRHVAATSPARPPACAPGDQLLIAGRDDSPATGRWLLRTVRRVEVLGVSRRRRSPR